MKEDSLLEDSVGLVICCDGRRESSKVTLVELLSSGTSIGYDG